MCPMHTDLTTTRRLAAAIAAAKAGPPRLTWQTVRANGGPSAASMTTYARGDGAPITDHGCEQLDAGLGWPKGTARGLVDPPLERDVSHALRPQPTITRVVDGRVVEVTDEPEWFEVMARLKEWMELGREILEELDRKADGSDVSP